MTPGWFVVFIPLPLHMIILVDHGRNHNLYSITNTKGPSTISDITWALILINSLEAPLDCANHASAWDSITWLMTSMLTRGFYPKLKIIANISKSAKLQPSRTPRLLLLMIVYWYWPGKWLTPCTETDNMVVSTTKVCLKGTVITIKLHRHVTVM